MSVGKFVNIALDFNKLSSVEQATQILSAGSKLLTKGVKGVAITYSANYGQTRTIENVYFAGGWDTQTDGANQAAAIAAMETLLGTTNQDLQGKIRIAPITTMNAYDAPADPWNDDVLMGIVTTDLDRIERYLMSDWCILGWQNQNTVNNKKHPYAVGGGVSSGFPQAVSDKVQTTLIGFSGKYASS